MKTTTANKICAQETMHVVHSEKNTYHSCMYVPTHIDSVKKCLWLCLLTILTNLSLCVATLTHTHTNNLLMVL